MINIKKNIPDFIFEMVMKISDHDTMPDIVEVYGITENMIKTLIEKNKLEWQSYLYKHKRKIYNEGLITWGTTPTYLYFYKDVEETYKFFILTYKLEGIGLLLMGLDKLILTK